MYAEPPTQQVADSAAPKTSKHSMMLLSLFGKDQLGEDGISVMYIRDVGALLGMACCVSGDARSWRLNEPL